MQFFARPDTEPTQLLNGLMMAKVTSLGVVSSAAQGGRGVCRLGPPGRWPQGCRQDAGRDGVDNEAVRAWSASNGIELSTRRRIPADVIDQYGVRQETEPSPNRQRACSERFSTRMAPSRTSAGGLRTKSL
jgi:hypothetical protein